MKFTKHFILPALTALTLTACNNAGQDDATNETAIDSSDLVYTCPADKILTTIEPYGDDADAPVMSADFKSYHVENGKRKDVMTTTTGLQYKVAQEGLKDGAQPVGNQVVTMHYHGYFPDGTKFDSSYDRSQTIQYPATGFIKGWIESLHDMKVCEARILYIPGDLAYGPSGRPGIPANATLLFKMQLIAVEPTLPVTN
ncbi:FKBP-type peptidyl-prolyl isomerase-like protein [Litorimonas taeanensis]|uniref:Peptidyl-prolyl cis-trans isomerase n=1 Tax=Litorimonas taeanensis TaxID=568099 RepID=A0A420WJE3_9PROT|nr:FKBP-type peptidyl-prolyl cis-trans isomerase [Litorimonas taeanensis]RKQ71035.1 FKBP-type peptidyl-prolyl isomerase-like protein [Litorimonas taeanensis]